MWVSYIRVTLYINIKHKIVPISSELHFNYLLMIITISDINWILLSLRFSTWNNNKIFFSLSFFIGKRPHELKWIFITFLSTSFIYFFFFLASHLLPLVSSSWQGLYHNWVNWFWKLWPPAFFPKSKPWRRIAE